MRALDDFAGSGWAVACRWLGIDEIGVELMPEARATRALNGFATAEIPDVWEHIASGQDADRDLYIASPPCQTFSMAGGGAGRKALDTVLSLIDERAYLRVDDLHAFGAEHDPRTALVLAPLVRIARDLPTYVVLEQVPPVLPVWQRYAEEMRKWGYSVWCGILNSEQYGVPQTRRRAVLIARADDIEAAPPTSTHSRYYSRDKAKLDEGVAPWVSMAEALGWGDFTAEKAMGRGFVERHGDRPGRDSSEPGFTIRGSAGGLEPGGFRLRSNYGTGGDPAARGERLGEEPASTVTSKADRAKWVHERPATTIPASDVVAGPGNFGSWVKGGVSRQDRPGATKVTIDEAAALQSYPADFQFAGTKTKQFLQVGNAVPPLMAAAILATLLPPK